MGISNEDILWVGTQGEIEESLVPKFGLRLVTISGGAVVGVPWRERIVNITRLAWSLGKSSRIIGDFCPDVLLMTGGYVNAPVGLAARMRSVPIVIYLPDIEPGLSIRELSRFAKKVACTTEVSLNYFKAGKGVVTGYPVRRQLLEATVIPREEALSRFNLKPSRPTLFVFGGSRGARSINRALMAGLPILLDKIQIIHASGMLDWEEVKQNADSLSREQASYYRPYPYLHDEMGFAFRSADLVLARAGASMLGECPAFGLPAILVPYPHAWRYQKVNADFMAAKGAAITMRDEDLLTMLVDTVLDLLENREHLEAISRAATNMNVPDSSANLARLLIEMGQGADL